MKKPGTGLSSSVKSRSFRVGGYSVAATVIVLAIAVALNIFVNVLPSKYTKISQLISLMSELDAAIESCGSDTVSSTITAPSSGRVKAIYAQAGESVLDTMYSDSTLMLLSLDGLMALDIEVSDGMSTGDGVTVTLSDGTQTPGRVSNISDGTATVTVSDNGPQYGENVTVTDESGTILGSAELYIHNELRLTGYAGTVSYVSVSLNSAVSSGQSLISLTDTSYTGQRDSLIKQRHDLEEQLSSLFMAYQDGKLYAQCAGRISGIDKSSLSTLAAKASALQAVLLSNSPTGEDDSAFVNYAASVTALDGGTATVNCSSQPVGELDYTALSSFDTSALTEQSTVTLYASTAVYSYSDSWQSGSVQDIQVGDLLIFTCDSAGSLVWIVRYSASGSSPSGPDSPGGSESGGMDSSGGSSMSGGSMSGGSMSGSSDTQEEETSYVMEETVFCSLTPYDTVTITISVDELDISALYLGQSAQVTLDALAGQSFQGSISAIDINGSNEDGGNTKYSVSIVLDRTEQMLSGMNASIYIQLSQHDDILLIPEAALQENGNEVSVYTGYDEKTDSLKDPVLVSTGVSDGTNVEILSGLEAGASFYYRYADTIIYTFS